MSQKIKILIVDDEPLMRTFIASALSSLNFELHSADNGIKAMQMLSTDQYDLIITDIKMPYKSGLDILQFTKTKKIAAPVILITAFASIETAIAALNMGAFNFLIKPFPPETLLAIVQKAIDHINLLSENHSLRTQIFAGREPTVIAASPSMKKILKDIDKIAKSSASVFISGESGSGKEIIARIIHHRSLRRSCPFVRVNCAAIVDTLLESEFFGHERGAFTGAEKLRIGRFEMAHTGSLLLDEITEIPLPLQPKLLRVLQEQELERVGGSKSIKIDVRFIAASNQCMRQAILKKEFREDLFYRLNVLPIHVPPLRERKEDIVPLANHFLEKFCAENHKPLKTLSEGAIQKLTGYAWPGNVRELANIIERSVVMNFSPIIAKEHIYLDSFCLISEKKADDNSLKEQEKTHILKTLQACAGSRSKAAYQLGITERTLRNKLKGY